MTVSQRLAPFLFVAAGRFPFWRLRNCGPGVNCYGLTSWCLGFSWAVSWSQHLDSESLILQRSFSGRIICCLGRSVLRCFSGCHSWKLSLELIWLFLQCCKHLILCGKSFSLWEQTRVVPVSIICKLLTDIVRLPDTRLMQFSFYFYKRANREFINKFENAHLQ